MSIQILLKDRISIIIKNNPDFKKSGKNIFEIVVASILNLKYLAGLDFDDLLDGVVGQGGDEGIDACYLFINEELVKEYRQLNLNKASSVRLEIIQAKETEGFSTNSFGSLCDGIEELFTLDTKKFKYIGANQDLVKKADLIKRIFREAKQKGASFKLRIHFATCGDKNKISSKIKHRQKNLAKVLSWVGDISFEFWGAQELFDLSTKTEERLTLEFIDQPLDLSEKGSQLRGYAGFMRGETLLESLLDENKRFKDELTEGNVRFFLGEDTSINSAIIETVSSAKADNFWAMNNGITIIGDEIRPGEKYEIVLDNPQIVNGCQTLHCLYDVYKENVNKFPGKLKIFVKAIQISNADIQEDIIQATNLQNKVATASFKANDTIQKNIEKSLLKQNIFYERRKNFYKRKGKTGLQVVSLEKMAQIMHSIFRKEAIIAVNQTKDLFQESDLYKKIFNIAADYDAYLFAVLLYQCIWSLKNSDLRNNGYEAEEKELRSKSLFCLLHIASSLIFRYSDKIDIAQPKKKNLFSKNSKKAIDYLKNENKVQKLYEKSTKIFLKCAGDYYKATKKVKNTLFKNRSFDRDYIIPVIKKTLGEK